jgi:hypothetical protein
MPVEGLGTRRCLTAAQHEEQRARGEDGQLDGYGPDGPPAPGVGTGAEDGVGGGATGVAGA